MCVDGAVMTIWSFSHIYYELSNHTDIYLENILHINHFPPSLPLAQHCGCADWPLDTHCHPNCSHLPFLPGLRIPMKRHSHKHRNIHATNTRTAMTSCMVSWRCMWAVKGKWAKHSVVNVAKMILVSSEYKLMISAAQPLSTAFVWKAAIPFHTNTLNTVTADTIEVLVSMSYAKGWRTVSGHP